MIKSVLFAFAIVPAVVMANISTNIDYEAGEKSTALVTPELKALAGKLFGANAEQLLHAVELNMAKYDLDMTTPSGRKSWHGKLHHEYTNDLYKVEVYTNEITGATWRYRMPFNKKDYASEVRRANSRLPKPVMTNGIPSALARARMKRELEKVSVSNVTVVIEANKRP